MGEKSSQMGIAEEPPATELPPPPEDYFPENGKENEIDDQKQLIGQHPKKPDRELKSLRKLRTIDATIVIATIVIAIIVIFAAYYVIVIQPSSSNEVTLNDRLRQPENNVALENVTVGNSSITYTYETPPDTLEYSVGDIIVGTAGSGYLRKITDIYREGNNIVVDTENASISDAVVKGRQNFSFSLTPQNITAETASLAGTTILEGADGPYLVRTQSDRARFYSSIGDDFTFVFPNVVIIIEHNNSIALSMTIDELRVTLSIRVYLNLEYWYGLDSFRCIEICSQKAEATGIEIQVNAPVDDLTNEIFLSNLPIGTMQKYILKVVTLSGWAGKEAVIGSGYDGISGGAGGSGTDKIPEDAVSMNIPVTFEFSLELKWGINALAALSNIEESFIYYSNYTAGAEYSDGIWTNIWGTQNNLSADIGPISTQGSLDFEEFLRADLLIRVYGVDGPGIFGKVFSYQQIDCPPLSCEAGVGAVFSIDYRMTVFSSRIIDYTADLADSRLPFLSLAAPSPPMNLMITPGNQQLSLSWQAPMTDGNLSIEGYKIYRGISPSEENYFITVSDTFCTDAGLGADQTYYYRVSAINHLGEGGRSDGVSATPTSPIGAPSSPQNLQASPNDGQVTLTWSAPLSNGGSPITNYSIYRSASSGEEIFLVEVGDVLTDTDTGLTNGVTYYYQVSALNTVGEGPRSIETSATPLALPTAPLNLQISLGSKLTRQNILTWSAPLSNGGSPITNYSIYRGISSGNETFLIRLENDILTYFDIDLYGGAYYYQVSASNSVGEGPRSNEVFSVPITVPDPPSFITIMHWPGPLPDSTLVWQPPIDNGGSEIIAYNIYWGRSSGGESLLWTNIVSNLLDPTTYYFYGGTWDVTYYFYITAVNVAGESSPSNELWITVPSS